MLVYRLEFTATFRVPGAAAWPWVQYGFVGVDIFFVISGYVILQSVLDRPTGQFALSRLIRLLPAFAVCMLLTSLVSGAASGRWPGPGLLLANLSFFPGAWGLPYIDDVYWSLGEEVQFYVLIAVPVMAATPRHLAAAFCAFVAVDLMQRLLFHAGMGLVGGFELPAAPWLAFFALGMVARWWTSGRRSASVVALFVVSAASAALVEIDRTRSLAAYHGISLSAGVPLAMGALAVAFVHLPASRAGAMPQRWLPLLLAASSPTYPLYLLHQEIGYLLLARSLALGVPPTLAPLLAATAIIALSFAVHAGIDVPLRRWLQRRLGLSGCGPA